MPHDIVFAYRGVQLVQTPERFEIVESGQLLAVATVSAVAERLFLYRALAIATAAAEEAQQQARFTPAGKLVYFPPPLGKEAGDGNPPAPAGHPPLGKGGKKKTAAPFQKPTAEEIDDYCRERDNGLNGQAIYDHYESNGWMVGRVKMKDWKAAVRTWEHKEREREQSRPVSRSRVALTNPEQSSLDMAGFDEARRHYRPVFKKPGEGEENG